jgi:Ca2+ transporting ATPase
MFFGMGGLVWGQVITSIPTHKLPHIFSWGASTPQEIEKYEEPDALPEMVDDMGRRGQILWLRGLTRLQHQIRVVNAFRMGLDADSFDKRSLSSLHSQHSLQNLRMLVLKKSTSYEAGCTEESAL